VQFSIDKFVEYLRESAGFDGIEQYPTRACMITAAEIFRKYQKELFRNMWTNFQQ